MKRIIILSLVMCLLLSGCSFVSFDDGQEIPTYNAPRASDIAEIDPLSCQDALFDESGIMLATYEALVPQFSEEGERSESMRRINSYYQSEIKALSQDMQSFFTHVENMNKESADASYVLSTYERTACSPEYVCILRKYSLYQNGVLSVHPTCQVFLTDTGWHLSFSELFGQNEEKALTLLKSGLTEWCGANGIPSLMVEEIDSTFLYNRFGIGEDTFFVCFEPFYLSAADSEYHIAELPLEGFEELFN